MKMQRQAAALAVISATAAVAAPAAAATRVAWLEIEGTLAERPGPFDWLSGGSVTLMDMVGTLEAIAADDDLDGLVLKLDSPAWSATQIEEIGAEIARVREAGKTVFAFSDIYDAGSLRLASYADTVVMQTGGAVFYPGMYMEEMFLKDTLGLVGITADYVQVGDYKGAKEQMSYSQPSEEWNENITGLLDQLYGAMRAEMRENRDLSDDELDRAMADAWYTDGNRAASLGLIDAEVDRGDFTDFLRAELGDDTVKFDLSYDDFGGDVALDMANPFALLNVLSTDPAHEPEIDTIAVVHIDGPIMDGESQPASAFGGGSVGAVTIRQALRDIEKEDLVRGVIVRINSPGGSAIASENIWQGVRQLAETKPVWVSVGSMAASGGYYIAVAGDTIYVDESSVVGSIGVVGGKLAMDGLYDKLGVTVVGRSRGPNAELFASGPMWTTAQRALVRQRMSETYDLFAGRVTQGRDGIDLSRTAEGRLFAGQTASRKP